MVKNLWVAAFLTIFYSNVCMAEVSHWGADYFPNVPLITQDGETVLFFDDLIKDKVVAINFIYTSCPDTCPLETAQLVKVQKILGDRVGKDVFFYSISIDPTTDTPQVLKEYQERFGARWTFLTGKESDIIQLRRKLGLYIEEIQDGSNNHNVSMIIGNQATGRWMKRSPFENSYMLAEQIGTWLSGWKAPPRGGDYASAPKLRDVPRGERLFRTRCTTCHTIGGKTLPGALGPDILGVTERREKRWLLDWLKAPDQMLEKKDPIAVALYKEYNNVAMPNMRLNQSEAVDLLAYIEEESERVLAEVLRTPRRSARYAMAARAEKKRSEYAYYEPEKPVTAAFTVSQDKPTGEDVVAIMNAWVRETDAAAKVNAGYMTLVNVGSEDVALVKVESEAFETIEVHEMVAVDGLMMMREIADLVIPANGQTQFAPGGKHLMLRSPRRHLTSGQKVDMTLTFKSGIKQTVTVKVAAR